MNIFLSWLVTFVFHLFYLFEAAIEKGRKCNPDVINFFTSTSHKSKETAEDDERAEQEMTNEVF